MIAYRSIFMLTAVSTCEVAERLLETCVQTDLWLPAHRLRGERWVHGAAKLLSRLCGTIYGREVLAGDVAHRLVELVHALLYACSDVVGAGRNVVLQSEYVGVRHVFHVDIVPGLLAAAVDRRGSSGD